MAAVAPAPELNQRKDLRAPTLPMNVVAPAPTVADAAYFVVPFAGLEPVAGGAASGVRA